MYTAVVMGEVRVEGLFTLIRIKMRPGSIDKPPVRIRAVLTLARAGLPQNHLTIQYAWYTTLQLPA